MKKTIIVMPVANEEDTMEKILDEILALPYDNLYIYPVIDRRRSSAGKPPAMTG